MKMKVMIDKHGILLSLTHGNKVVNIVIFKGFAFIYGVINKPHFLHYVVIRVNGISIDGFGHYSMRIIAR